MKLAQCIGPYLQVVCPHFSSGVGLLSQINLPPTGTYFESLFPSIQDFSNTVVTRALTIQTTHRVLDHIYKLYFFSQPSPLEDVLHGKEDEVQSYKQKDCFTKVET